MTTESILLPTQKIDTYAQTFAALGDRTRLALLAKLANHKAYSISELTSDTSITRQAITKHLQILQKVGLVKNNRYGRKNLFELENHTQPYLDLVIASTRETGSNTLPYANCNI